MTTKPVPTVFPEVLPCDIALVGEAPSADESLDGLPFVGASGKLLDGLLAFAKIDRSKCMLGNVFTIRPPQNDVSFFFLKTKLATPEQKKNNPYHPNHGYLKDEYLPELARIRDDLARANPKVIIPMGGIALWALYGESKITDYRGTVIEYIPHEQHAGGSGPVVDAPTDVRESGLPAISTAKLLPTFHPAAALRDYGLRPIIAQDLLKATGELSSGTVSRPNRTVHIIECPDDLRTARDAIKKAGTCAFDVETLARQITCISLAPDETTAYVIPFWDLRKPGYNAFDEATELELWWGLWEIMSDSSIRKLAHNAEYDLVYLDHHGIKVRGRVDDTMLLAHSYQIEWPKSLGFLGSIYCNETAWKNLRAGKKVDRNKADE